MIDISQINLNIYSKDELLNFSDSGILFCGDMDLTEFVQKIMEGNISEDDLEEAEERASELEDEIEAIRDKIATAMSVLESI